MEVRGRNVKLYKNLILYNARHKLEQWKSFTLLGECRHIKTQYNRWLIRYEKDPYLSTSEPTYTEWTCVQGNAYSDIVMCIAGLEIYDLKFLDGVYKADDIMFALSRKRLGCVNIEEQDILRSYDE